MTWNDRRLPRGFFRLETQPEEGARIADVVDAVIPGGKGFVQQLFRAKKDVLQAFSHLLQAQVRELENIDTAIQDGEREGSASSSGGKGPGLSPRMRTIKEMMQEASARRREQDASAGPPPPQSPPAAPQPPQGGTPEPEKFKPT
ncbi:hypothetical protein LZ198_28520 [Myxococcus sp. K15C18031901]|uniref:hypothetical protein n=1 Tax=Myxococcus dinghuensis TaxID=2906761 RepID=UPI0020A6E207|nr:hypothetical protein [Myxococcus dinghuensis]MCP3102828.1 hypothetical protein [Myxococcus dinghuensis]